MTVSLTQTVCYSDVPCNLNAAATGKRVYVTVCLVLLKALNVFLQVMLIILYTTEALLL